MKINAGLLLLLLPFFAASQHHRAKEQFAINQYTVDAGFTGLQGGAEWVTGKTATLQLRGGVLPLLYRMNEGYGEQLKWVAGLSVSGEYRYYYNFWRRLEKGKEVTNNGANYFSLLVLYITKPLGKNKNLDNATAAVVAGPMWGFNRALGDRGYFHFSLGPALQHEIKTQQNLTTLYGDLRFCIRLHK